MRIAIVRHDALDPFSPKLLIIHWKYYGSIMFRIRPFYIRIKVWWTRQQLVDELHAAWTDKSIWTPATFVRGSIYRESSQD